VAASLRAASSEVVVVGDARMPSCGDSGAFATLVGCCTASRCADIVGDNGGDAIAAVRVGNCGKGAPDDDTDIAAIACGVSGPGGGDGGAASGGSSSLSAVALGADVTARARVLSPLDCTHKRDQRTRHRTGAHPLCSHTAFSDAARTSFVIIRNLRRRRQLHSRRWRRCAWRHRATASVTTADDWRTRHARRWVERRGLRCQHLHVRHCRRHARIVAIEFVARRTRLLELLFVVANVQQLRSHTHSRFKRAHNAVSQLTLTCASYPVASLRLRLCNVSASSAPPSSPSVRAVGASATALDGAATLPFDVLVSSVSLSAGATGATGVTTS
jgi:hypothetical protein